MMRSQEKGGFAKYSFSEHNKEVRRCQTDWWGWTAVSSRLGLISSTFALYRMLELELFEYFKSTRTLVNPSQVYMFRRTVFNDQKFENFQSKACNYVQVL